MKIPDEARYFVHAPSPPVTSMRVIDAGLTVMSKHAISKVDFVLYKKGCQPFICSCSTP